MRKPSWHLDAVIGHHTLVAICTPNPGRLEGPLVWAIHSGASLKRETGTET